MRGNHRTAECADCGAVRELKGRRLCAACNWRHWNAGTVHLFPRVNLRSADLVEDYEFLARTQGYTRRQAAERMGITKARLEKAIERQQRRTREAS